MKAEDYAAAASRICTACGMCCDGTMFQIVKLQTGDRPSELGKLGLKVRSRDGEFFMEQPCPALRDTCCTVYEKRPARCRLFHCQQLRLMDGDHTTEREVMTVIASARELVEQVNSLILQNGLREDGQALLDRYERVMSTPVDAKMEPDLAEARHGLDAAMQKLRRLLNREFRPPPLSN